MRFLRTVKKLYLMFHNKLFILRSLKKSVGERSAMSKNDSKRGSSYPSFFIPGKWYPRLAETSQLSFENFISIITLLLYLVLVESY